MKSVIYSAALICVLSLSTFAQGRGGGTGGGRSTGPSAIPPRPEPSVSRPSSSDTDRGNRPTSSSDRVSSPANAKADARLAEGKGSPSQQLSDNPALASRMKELFPDGTDLGAMAGGFKNLGQFVAAAHVSHNLNIPFDQLKSRMTTDDASLGDAIHALKPDMAANDVKSAVKKAEDQAKKDTNRKG